MGETVATTYDKCTVAVGDVVFYFDKGGWREEKYAKKIVGRKIIAVSPSGRVAYEMKTVGYPSHKEKRIPKYEDFMTFFSTAEKCRDYVIEVAASALRDARKRVENYEADVQVARLCDVVMRETVL